MSAIVLIEAIFAVCFATIQDRSIKNADERVKTQTLITHLNLVSLLWCSAAANSFQHMAQNKGTETGTLVRYRTQIKNEFQQIQPLLDGEAERRPIAELEKAMQDTIALLTGLQQCWPYNDRRFFE
ncbi:MAG TPA: hypothetical protein V6C72_02815, partial [Chroococcales cyanobacterium]